MCAAAANQLKAPPPLVRVQREDNRLNARPQLRLIAPAETNLCAFADKKLPFRRRRRVVAEIVGRNWDGRGMQIIAIDANAIDRQEDAALAPTTSSARCAVIGRCCCGGGALRTETCCRRRKDDKTMSSDCYSNRWRANVARGQIIGADKRMVSLARDSLERAATAD